MARQNWANPGAGFLAWLRDNQYIRWVGTYDATKAYARGDLVVFGGQFLALFTANLAASADLDDSLVILGVTSDGLDAAIANALPAAVDASFEEAGHSINLSSLFLAAPNDTRYQVSVTNEGTLSVVASP